MPAKGTDDDGDTLPDTYESDNGLDPLDAGDALVDSDDDGFSNVEELQAGTLAGDAASAPVMNSDVILFSAVLPTSRSVTVGTAATAFATIVNGGTVSAVACKLSLASMLTADFSFTTTNPQTNAIEGLLNFPAAEIAAGAFQTYVFAITPTAAFAPTEVQLAYRCANAEAAPLTVGLNTLLLSASNTPIPDIVALAATPNNDGVVSLPGTTGSTAFSVATVNVGASGDITMTVDTGTASPSVILALCETDPTVGNCINPSIPTTRPVVTSIAANGTPTFAVFVTGTGEVPFDPANNRVFVRFMDALGVTRGATSVAVRTQ